MKPENNSAASSSAKHAKAPAEAPSAINVFATPDGAGVSASQPAQPVSRKRRVIAVVVALLLLAVVIVLAVGHFTKPVSNMEPNVIVGTLEGYTDEQIQEMLNKKVEEGMISFSLNTSMYLASPDAETSIKFENPPNNAKLTKLRIVRDDTAEQIYETGFVEPGTYVDTAKLNTQLESGTYTCTGYISSYRQETKQYLGEAACAITITVA